MSASASFDLRQQTMINQFVFATGCTSEEAKLTLERCKWQYDIAISTYHSELGPMAGTAKPSQLGTGFQPNTPANTPVTPPAFPDTMTAFKSLRVAGDGREPLSLNGNNI
eukprot:Colp12_sorted_trinity150504_noHs@7869